MVISYVGALLSNSVAVGYYLHYKAVIGEVTYIPIEAYEWGWVGIVVGLILSTANFWPDSLIKNKIALITHAPRL